MKSQEETPRDPKIFIKQKKNIPSGLTLNDAISKKSNNDNIAEFTGKQENTNAFEINKSKTTKYLPNILKNRTIENKENKHPNSMKNNDLNSIIMRREKEKSSSIAFKSKSQLFDKTTKRHNNYLNSNNDRTKNIDNEMDIGFMPQDMLYADKATYGESSINLLAAIEILEKAQDNKNKLMKNEPVQDKSFWSFINPFQCGNYN